MTDIPGSPDILAPAGNKEQFLAAVAAKADAVYCGLKDFSARKQATNFTMEELKTMVEFAENKGMKVYVAFNSLIRSCDIQKANDLIAGLASYVRPHGLIVQDPGVVRLAKANGFLNNIHLSTLAGAGFSRALFTIYQKLGISRVVLPREISLDEIRILSEKRPQGLDLEVFIHGAICYGFSGKCYWSSYLGGKSGLTGACVQPCRRIYRQNNLNKKYFSCRDLELDVLVRTLLTVPGVRTWKIEGRKKGPHYVYYTVSAYRLLRDHPNDPKAKKDALGFLRFALGRAGTHYHFLPQRPFNPVDTNTETGSGLFVGKVKGAKANPFITPGVALLKNDEIRVGYADETMHQRIRVGKDLPKGGRFNLRKAKDKKQVQGAPVFLVDRKEKALEEKMQAFTNEMESLPKTPYQKKKTPVPGLPKPGHPGKVSREMTVFRKPPGKQGREMDGVWISPEALDAVSPGVAASFSWWLPPVILPGVNQEEENMYLFFIDKLREFGARDFVLNTPWQMGFFNNPKTFRIWAGPFCNIMNPQAVGVLKEMGFSGCIVSPEMGREDMEALPWKSPLPLGVVVSGNWPLSISRIIPPGLKENQMFTSPKKETAWYCRHGMDTWVFPGWEYDIREYQDILFQYGYRLFIHIKEPFPPGVSMKERPGFWNWDIGLK